MMTGKFQKKKLEGSQENMQIQNNSGMLNYYFKEKFFGESSQRQKNQSLINPKLSSGLSLTDSKISKKPSIRNLTNISMKKVDTFESIASEANEDTKGFSLGTNPILVEEKKERSSNYNNNKFERGISPFYDLRPFTSESVVKDSKFIKPVVNHPLSRENDPSKKIISAASTSTEFYKTARGTVTSSQKLRKHINFLSGNLKENVSEEKPLETIRQSALSVSRSQASGLLNNFNDKRVMKYPTNVSISKFAETAEEFTPNHIFEDSPRERPSNIKQENETKHHVNNPPPFQNHTEYRTNTKQNSRSHLMMLGMSSRKKDESFLEVDDYESDEEEREKNIKNGSKKASNGPNYILQGLGYEKPVLPKGTSYDIFWGSVGLDERQSKRINAMIYSRFILSYFIKEKKVIAQENNSKLKSQRMEVLRILLEGTKNAVEEIIDMIPKARESCHDREKIENILSNMEKIADNVKLPELMVCLLFVKGKIFRIHKDYFRAIHIFKQCKNLSMVHKITELQMKCYKALGKVYKDLRKHLLSLIYFTKGNFI